MKRIVAALAAALFIGYLSGQTPDGKKILLHVTSVEQKDAPDVCSPDNKCSATRFTVGGYAVDGKATIEYVLECSEIVSFEPTLHTVVQCIRVHAHADYEATLYPDAISIPTDRAPSDADKPHTSLYTIKSEREVSRN